MLQSKLSTVFVDNSGDKPFTSLLGPVRNAPQSTAKCCAVGVSFYLPRACHQSSDPCVDGTKGAIEAQSADVVVPT